MDYDWCIYGRVNDKLAPLFRPHDSNRAVAGKLRCQPHSSKVWKALTGFALTVALCLNLSDQSPPRLLNGGVSGVDRQTFEQIETMER